MSEGGGGGRVGLGREYVVVDVGVDLVVVPAALHDAPSILTLLFAPLAWTSTLVPLKKMSIFF
jgi:hypothetical protein